MSKAEEQALKAYPKRGWKCKDAEGNDTFLDSNRGCRLAYVQGYEQALKDMKETFEEMSKNTNSAIEAVKVLGSLLDNSDIRKKLGKSKPIPKKPIKTNPFFGGEKK